MQRPRTPSRISESLHQRLNSYALAASAAGVGMLVLAQPAEARIVYTKTHVVLTGLSNMSYLLDLNHDGINDFSLSDRYFFFQSGNAATLRCIPEGSLNGARVPKKGFVMALPAGVRVGPGERFNQSEFMGAVSYHSSPPPGFYGPWVNDGRGVKDRYLGLKFMINGKTHYGWARLDVKVDGQYIVGITATLTGYAYETVPNKPIIAGKTKGPNVITIQDASLGHLARGASAMQAWRAANSAK
jgi:hypothetical protein